MKSKNCFHISPMLIRLLAFVSGGIKVYLRELRRESVWNHFKYDIAGQREDTDESKRQILSFEPSSFPTPAISPAPTSEPSSAIRVSDQQSKVNPSSFPTPAISPAPTSEPSSAIRVSDQQLKVNIQAQDDADLDQKKKEANIQVEDNAFLDQKSIYQGESKDMLKEVEIPLLKSHSKNKKPKLFFFAGVAYSGHDIIQQAIKQSCASEPGKCVSLCGDVIHPSVFYAESEEDYTYARKITEQKLAELSKKVSAEKVYIGNLYGNCSVPTTYPDITLDGRDHRSHFHPDIFLLANIAEKTGWNLQIILLLRDVEFLSNQFLLNHESIGLTKPGKPRMDIGVLKLMEMSLRNLYSQISMIDETFYFCYSFDYIDDTQNLAGLMRLANLDTNILVGYNNRMINAMGTGPSEGVQLFIKTLKLVRQSMNKLCTRNKRNLNDLFKGSGIQDSEEVAPRPFGLSSMLKKTVFTGLRLVFFAGLEGSGHHLWQSVLQPLIEQGIINADCKLNSIFMKGTMVCWNAYHDPNTLFFCSGLESSFRKGYRHAVNFLRKFVDSGATGTYLLNIVGGKKNCGSIASYPCFSGRDKAMQKPDVLKLAELCERVGVDFRVVVLERNTVDMVHSDIWHRRFNRNRTKLFEERVLENNGASLYTELALLDPKFYSCTQFADSSFQSAVRVGKLMKAQSIIYELKSHMRPEKLNATTKHIPSGHYDFIHTLRTYNSAISSLCSNSQGHL